MKCIEDEIPFEVPEGWAWTRLGAISSAIQYGLSNSSDTKGSHKLLRITDIQEGKVNWDTVPFTTTNDPDTYMLKSGDIVFARTGATVGKSFLITETPYPAVYASYLIRIRLLRELPPEYIYQFFDSACYWSQITDKSVGVGQPNCNGTSLKELFIPLPPMNEQVKIVPTVQSLLNYVKEIGEEKTELLSILSTTKSKILDLAIRGKLVPQDPNDEPASALLERIRAEKEELIKQGKIKRDKKESIIFRGDDNSYFEKIGNDTFDITDSIPFEIPNTWMWCRLKCVAANEDNSFVDGPFGSDLKTIHYTKKEEVRIVQLNNIGEEGWKDTGKKYTTFLHAKNIERCISFPDDIVIAKMMPAGRTIILPTVNSMYVISSDCIRLRADYRLNKDYLMFMLNSPSINKYVLDNVQGIGRTRTSLNKMKDLLIPVPPESEQQKICKMVNTCFNYLSTIHNEC